MLVSAFGVRLNTNNINLINCKHSRMFGMIVTVTFNDGSSKEFSGSSRAMMDEVNHLTEIMDNNK